VSQAAAPPRPPGRPRSAEADAAIVAATLELLVEDGFQGLSVEAVRQRAGVGKATIYRRFPDKVALVRAALDHLHAKLEVPDTGSVRDDLAAVWQAAYQPPDTPELRLTIPRLLVDSMHHPELFDVFRAALVEPRRAVMKALLTRGIQRGELRADLELELAVDMLAGPMVYRLLIEGGSLDDPVGRSLRLFDALMEGWAPPAPRGRARG
jgi:AcrR family transcriptional regulator